MPKTQTIHHATASQTVQSKDGTHIAYETTGQGPPLILVMGALGSKDLRFSQDYAKALAQAFTVINYDRRGRGASTDTKPYALQREVEDLDALVKTLPEPPLVFGLSSGAALALEAAAAGVRFRHILAYEPPYAVGQPKDAPPADFRQHLERLAAEDKRDEAVTYFMRVVGVPALAVWVMKRFPFWKDLKQNAHTLPYDAAIMNQFQVPAARFAKIRVPTLLATGSKSPKKLQAAARATADVIPGATLQVLPKQNHGVKPAAVLQVARALEGQPSLPVAGQSPRKA